jgi:hypothetical protein
MKRIPILLTFSLLLALFATSCSNQVQEVTEAAALQAKVVSHTTQHYSLIPGNSRSAYSAEVIEYTDGSAQVIRSIVPYDANANYVHSVVSNNVPIAHSSQGADIDFSSGDGWFVPFDPGIQAIQVIGRVVHVDCSCDNGPGGCNLDVIVDPSNGKADIGCLGDQNCTGNCRAHLTFGSNHLTHDGGILINATEVITP